MKNDTIERIELNLQKLTPKRISKLYNSEKLHIMVSMVSETEIYG